MDSFEVDGGVHLHGEVTLSGSKNASLPIMTASILAHGKIRLRRVPRLRDIETTMRILRSRYRAIGNGAAQRKSGSNAS